MKLTSKDKKKEDSKNKHTLQVKSKIDINKYSDIKTIIDKIYTELKFINAVEIVDRIERYIGRKYHYGRYTYTKI